MSFFAQPSIETPAKPKTFGNVTADDFNSSQEGIPITYLAGMQYITGQFMTPAYNVVHKKITQQTGKDSSETQGFTDYADFALALCMGGRMPVRQIYKVIINAEIVWKNNDGLGFGGSEHVDITIPDYGKIRIYRGSFTQPRDTLVLTKRSAAGGGIDPRDQGTWPFNEAVGGEALFNGMAAGDSHPLSGHYDDQPAYRPVCYLVAKKFLLGRNPSPIPTIMLELQRDMPWFTGAVVDRDAMGLNAVTSGVNPIGVVFDFVTDPVFGLRQPESLLYQPGWADALDKCKGIRISPRITEMQPANELFAELSKYAEFSFRERDGLLDIVVYDRGAIDLTTVPVLTDDDLDGEPELKPLDWSHVDPEIDVTFSERTHHYKSSLVRYRNPNARRIVGNQPPAHEPRPFFTNRGQAIKYKSELGAMRSQPIQTGNLPIKREWLDDNDSAPDAVVRDVRECDRVLFNSASRGLSILLRINEYSISDDKSGRADLEVENERGFLPELFIPPAVDLLGDFEIEPVEITTARILELPSGLTDSNRMQIAVLAMRPRHETTGFFVHTSVDNSVYDLGPGENTFAVFGKLGADYPADTDDLDLTDGMDVDLFGWDLERVVSQTTTQRENVEWLCIVDDGANTEIHALGQVVPLADGRSRFFNRRKLYGTPKVAHLAGANVWLIPRAELNRISNANFVPGATRYFKLQPFTPLEMLDLADADAIAYVFGNAPAVGSVFDIALTTSAGVAEGKTPDVRIIAIWDALSDQDITSFEIAYQKDGETTWTSIGGITEKVRDWDVDPNTLYNVKIRALNRHNAPSDWSATQQILSGTLLPFDVRHLELEGQADDLNFTGRIAKLRWGISSFGAFEEIGQETGGIQAGEVDPLFKDYLLEAYTEDFTELLFERPLQDPKFDLDVVELCGARPTIGIQVVARSTVGNGVSQPNRIVIANPAPAALTNLHAIGGLDHIDVTHNAIVDLDGAGVLGWRSTDPDFVVEDDTAPIYDGPGGSFAIAQPSGTTYYYRFAAYDEFGKQASRLNISPAILVKTATLYPTRDAPSVTPGSQSFSAPFNANVTADPDITVHYDLLSDVQVTSPLWPSTLGVYDAISIDTSCILHVRGYEADGTPTKQAKYLYTLVASGSGGTGTCGSVTRTHVSGALGSNNYKITLACATSGATIKYKINGGATQTYVSGNITLGIGDAINYWAEKAGLNPSPHGTFTNEVDTPDYEGGGTK